MGKYTLGISSIETNEVPAHKKKKQSNISSSKKKSKHKHDYEPVLVVQWCKQILSNPTVFPDKNSAAMVSLGERCRVCGKVRITRWIFSREELEKYQNLPIIDQGMV